MTAQDNMVENIQETHGQDREAKIEELVAAAREAGFEAEGKYTEAEIREQAEFFVDAMDRVDAVLDMILGNDQPHQPELDDLTHEERVAQTHRNIPELTDAEAELVATNYENGVPVNETIQQISKARTNEMWADFGPAERAALIYLANAFPGANIFNLRELVGTFMSSNVECDCSGCQMTADLTEWLTTNPEATVPEALEYCSAWLQTHEAMERLGPSAAFLN